MSHPLEDLVFRPLFYEALQGDIYLPDNLHSNYPTTLGHLITEARMFTAAGEFSDVWAPEVKISLGTDEEMPNWRIINSVHLANKDGRKLNIYDETPEGESALHFGNPDNLHYLRPGTIMVSTRTFVTRAIQTIFDR